MLSHSSDQMQCTWGAVEHKIELLHGPSTGVQVK